MATIVLLTRPDGQVVFANAAAEDVLSIGQRALEQSRLQDLFIDPQEVVRALAGAQGGAFSALRYDAQLLRTGNDPIPVHVIVAPTDAPDEVLIELLPLEQQSRQEREERLIDQAQANKELIRNLAHEIKNPLGGIRGAAQLLQMEIESRDLTEYTQVIVREADRLQTLVDRLLAPHRRPHVVGPVNIHEVCERVRSLIVAEFPRGLQVIRDYDISLPEFQGDKEQLIQAVLNIVHNAAQALSERIAREDATIRLETRAVRQVTIAKQRHRLALELHVVDNGPGIPEEIKDRLFSPLVSGRDGGSGLGLNLAQTFVQQHKGLIECDSEPGHTDFKIMIPL
ncbi:MAG: PAS domain-containing sensor histidine kinase [Betaproteobacteria bacterium]|nr:PAS domain-containing sensor histidine kinase [Betaproteobacteria bacterium]NBO88527.1 PAS domain-containing sensor histidine kinase [Betaproteobacteria bacterium]NBU43723.1 PAS domain-containing sensor histidine kinase [Betaproteobacteria bacterium]NCW39227.1 PAS domain-containing sensor histidine kinase [Betaproteobacteria bacterium]